MKHPKSNLSERETDSWFSREQLRCVEPSEAYDDLHSPVPTRMHSNGEYMPHPQTEEQKRAERKIRDIADRLSQQLGMSRRRYLASPGGMAACFWAMNEVHGPFFAVSKEELGGEPSAAKGFAPPTDLFVFDDQTHAMRSSLTPELVEVFAANRAAAQGPSMPGFQSNPYNLRGEPDESGDPWRPWNPQLVGLPYGKETYQVTRFIKDLFLDSQLTVAVLSNAPAAILAPPGSDPPPPLRNADEAEPHMILTPLQTVRVRDFVNDIAGSKRLLAHGILSPGVGNLEYVRYQAEALRPDSWKGYTAEGVYSAKVDHDPGSPLMEWRLDDEQVAYPSYELISEYQKKYRDIRPGFGNICIHKGPTPTSIELPQYGHPADIPQAAADWPHLNFIIYHAAFRNIFSGSDAWRDLQSGLMREGVPDIRWTTELAQLTANCKNVYAEIGTTFSATVVTYPTVCAHILGQLLKYKGEDHVVFGSDYPWAGAPQWQIEALWRFQIPEELQKKYGYPPLTETVKRKILGLNSARIYGMTTTHPQVSNEGPYKPVPTDYEARMDTGFKAILEFPGYTDDKLSEIRKAYQAMGILPDHTRHGWIRRG